MQTNDGKLQWHPAFDAALHIELEENLDILDIQTEHLLSKKPMQIDVLIVKKESEQKIKKKIGHLFLKHNIIEYKSPEDYLSINDFYKVYGYACFYQSDTDKVCEIRPEELTITYVCCHYPQKMIQHLENVRGLTIRKYAPGIYYAEGDPIPIQIIVTRQLSKTEYFWLQNMRTDLKAGKEINELVKKYEVKKTSPYYQAVMDLIVRANWDEMEEGRIMCEALKELFADELEVAKKDALEQGIQRGIQQGIQRGIQQGIQQGAQLTKSVFKLSLSGCSIEEIAAKCNISEQMVLEILED